MRWLKRTGAKKAPAPRRPAPRWVAPAKRAARLAAVALAAVGGPAALWHSGLVGLAASALGPPLVEVSAGLGLTVKQVLAEGRTETSRGEILAAVGVLGGEPIFAVDPEAARKRLEALPWVRAASVERRLPDTIRVRLLERHPMAWWQKDGKLVLIDRAGEPIRVAPSGRFSELMVLVGDDAPQNAAALIAMLGREPELAPRVHAAVRVGQRRWNLKIDGAIDVRLPEDGAEAAWSKLGELERKHRILSRDIEAVDLRLPDRLIVQTKGGRISPAAVQGRDT